MLHGPEGAGPRGAPPRSGECCARWACDEGPDLAAVYCCAETDPFGVISEVTWRDVDCVDVFARDALLLEQRCDAVCAAGGSREEVYH